MKKMHSLVSLNEQSDLYFFQNFEFTILKLSKTSKKYSGGPKKNRNHPKNYLYLISLFDDTTEKDIFLPKKVSYLSNRINDISN